MLTGRAVVQAGEQDIEALFVQLYMSILLAFLMRSCPELRDTLQQLLPMASLIEDLQTSLVFYVSHGAMEAESIGRLRSLIEELH